MTTRKLLYISVGFILVGGIITSFWVYLAGGGEFLTSLAQIQPGYIMPLLLIMAYYIFFRFIRWQFLLRRANVRVATRPSFAIFLASLAGVATPAYVGEVIRSVLMRHRFGVPIRITTLILVIERLLDVVALGLIGAATVDAWWIRGVMVALIAVAGLVGFMVGGLAPRLGISAALVRQLAKSSTLIQALIISLVTWIPATLLVSLAAASLEVWVDPLAGMGVFSAATLLGGMTLTPAGVGSTGSLAIFQLQTLGLSLTSSVVMVSLIRLVTVGVALTVSVVFLFFELKNLRQMRASEDSLHFDEIAWEYGAQFSEHIWEHLLERKIRLLTAALPSSFTTASIGLDLGCGFGQQCLTMSKRGYRVVGMDPAQNLVRQAHRTGVTVTTGNALALPFKNASLDFVYTVGVLHHLSGVKMQVEAYREVVRVLKPGGFFIVHETNPRNPLFRFYMGYLFPLLKSIDEGIEWWIEPDYWQSAKPMKLVDLQYFTFLPDFIPPYLMRPLLVFQQWFEASPLCSYSVHYMAVLQKEWGGSLATMAKPVMVADAPFSIEAK